MRVTQDPHIGTILQDKYRVISEIGRGGMSIVYKARHEMMDKQVAIKMLQQGLMGDQTSIKRFQQEAQAASCLAHQNVITIFDFGVSPTGQPYLVMDFLEGQSLADVIKAQNHISQRRAASIFIQACDALEHAHQKGVLHRDLKSSNIMLVDYDSNPDFVKVVDFGIAKLMPNSGKQQQNLTATGEIFGSPIYMSPEQCLGLTLDARSDIYSMGTMLYEALTGQPPLLGANIIDTMQMHVESVPARPSKIRSDLQISGPLEMICVRALEKKPENRFKSMGEFRDALLAIVPLLPVEAGQLPNRQFRTGTRQNMPGVVRQNATGAQTGASGALTGPGGNREFPGGQNAPKGITSSAAPSGYDPRVPQQEPRDRFAPPAPFPAPSSQMQSPTQPPSQSPLFQQGQNPNYSGPIPNSSSGPNSHYSTGQVPNIQGQNFQQPQQPPQQMPQQPQSFQSPQQPQFQPQHSQQQQQPPQQNQQQFSTGQVAQNPLAAQQPQQYPGGQQFATGGNFQNPQNSQVQTGHQGFPQNATNPGNANNANSLNFTNQSQISTGPTGPGQQLPSPQTAPTGWPVLQPDAGPNAGGSGGSQTPPFSQGIQSPHSPQSLTGAQQGLSQGTGMGMGQTPMQQSLSGPQGSFPQQAMTSSQLALQSSTSAQPQHLMASNRPEILTTGSYAATGGPEIAAGDDSLFGNPSLYGEKNEDETIQFQTQYERNKSANKVAPSNSVRHVPDHLPSKRINSDYSDLLEAGEKKAKKGGTGSFQVPKRTIYAPELPANKTGLIVMIVLCVVLVLLIMVAVSYVLFKAVKPG